MPEEHADTEWWWEEYPDRLAIEFDALERHGIKFERDEEAFARGVLRLHLHPEIEGQTLHLIATFPDSYPYFPFEVVAPDLNLPHHQHARAKTLCFLPRSTQWWRSATDRLGDFIADRLPLVLQLGVAEDTATVANGESREESQAEPYSDYYLYHLGAVLIVDGKWRIPEDMRAGFLRIGVIPPPSGQHPSPVLNGAILEVQDEGRRILAKVDPRLSKLYAADLQARWVRFDRPIEADKNPELIFMEALAALPKAQQALKTETVIDGGIQIIGILYPEERQWRGLPGDIFGDAWLFAIRFLASPYSKKSKGRQKPTAGFYLARSCPAGKTDLSARIPELTLLDDKSIALFGLGCIGAPSALELARAGIGDLRILDRDFVDPATTVRWPLGFTAGGHPKARIIKNFIAANYPFTKTSFYEHAIGGARPEDGESEQLALAGMLDGASLLYDATAEYGVERFLADKAAERSIPYIGVQATPGGWGGLIVRIIPGRTEGCWMCLQLARHLKEEAEALRIPNPPTDPHGDELQPTGCANPTFTGANFDVMEVALAGVRTAVSTLCAGHPGSYPEIDWDVAVLSLRTQTGKFLLPTWQTFRLGRHPRCPACASRA